MEETKEYQSLTELERIPYRIATAKRLALRDLHSGVNMDRILKGCIEKEYYCGAEGIKQAIQEFRINLT